MYDVIIIGAGPAGSIAAFELAAKHNVLLLDRTHPSCTKHSGEYVPGLLFQHETKGREAIIQDVEGMVMYTAPDTEDYIRAPGYIIDRKKYNESLLCRAKDNGCAVQLKTTARLADDCVKAYSGSSEQCLNAKIYIAADGSHSRSRKKFATKERSYVITLVRELKIQRELKNTFVFFHPEIYGGYGWLFPMGKYASCGVGVDIKRARSLKHAWDIVWQMFSEKKLVSQSMVINEYYNIIYTGGPLSRCVFGNVVIVGDAAGQVHSITGAGIGNAVLCSSILAKACSRSLQENDPSRLDQYETDWRRLFEAELKRGKEHRNNLLKHWNTHTFKNLIRKNWVAFNEYYKEKK